MDLEPHELAPVTEIEANVAFQRIAGGSQWHPPDPTIAGRHYAPFGRKMK